MDAKATCCTIQTITHNFPSQASLKLWKKVTTALCPFCQKEAETTAHFSQKCPQFSDARTKAHDTAWGAAWAEMLKHKDTEWTAIHDTTMGKTTLLHDAEYSETRPDGIMHNATLGMIIIFEFTRTGGYTAKDSQEAEEAKEYKYRKLTESIDKLNKHKYKLGARLCVITCTFTGALDAAGITTKLQQVLDPKKPLGPHKVLQALVKATLEAFNEMADIRLAAKAKLGTP